MLNKLVITKSHFFFGKGQTARSVVNTSYSNIFFTLSDFNYKVVITKTSGTLAIGNSKRKKVSTQAVDSLVKNFIIFFKAYKIKRIAIYLKTRVNKFIWALIYKLKYFGYSIAGYAFRKRIAHNGMRVRKPRRR